MATLYPAPQKALDLLRNPPGVGEGRHHWIFRVAHALVWYGWKPGKVKEYLTKVCAAKGWQDRSGKTIDDALARIAEGWEPEPDPTGIRPMEWPEVSKEARQRRFASTPLFDGDRETGLTAKEVLPRLFPNDPLVCFGWTKFNFSTAPLSTLIESARNAPYLVANPMRFERAESGSKRSQGNACLPSGRTYLVVEFDGGDTRQQQAAVLSSLSTQAAPLVLAVWSGGKSVHGWFKVKGLDQYSILRFFRFAVYLGADATLWDTAKLVRMPGGTRENALSQPVLYLNGDVV